MGIFTDLVAGLGYASATIALSPRQGDETNRNSGFATSLSLSGLLGTSIIDTLAQKPGEDLRKGYGGNPYVFAVAAWKAMRFAQAVPLVYAIKDKKAYREYSAHRTKAMQLGLPINEDLRSKAMEAIDSPPSYLAKLLATPNPTQTWTEIMTGLSIYYDFGNALIRGIRLKEGANKGKVTELWLLPTARWSGLKAGLVGFAAYSDSQGQELPAEQILHLRRFSAAYDNTTSTLWGESLLHAAGPLLSRSNEAFKAEATLMSNQGPRTVLFPKGTTYNPQVSGTMGDATKAIRQKLASAGAGGIAGFNVELGKLDIGMSPVDLNILQSNQLSREDFCALWKLNVLSVFSTMAGATYANLKEANVMSLRAGVLPDLFLAYEKLTSFIFQGDDKGKYVLLPDTDVYPELQPDWEALRKKADAMPLTGDERRAMFGYGELGTPEMGIPMLPNGYAPMSDFMATPDDVKNDQKY